MRRRKIWISGLALVMALLWFGVAGAAEEPVSELFSDIPILTQQARAAELIAREQQDEQDPTILRSRYVIVNFDKLAGKEIPQGADTIVLNIFADVSFTAVKERLERRSSTKYTWFGRIEGAKYSQVILTVSGTILFGNVMTDGKLYSVQALGGGVHALYEIDQSALPGEFPPGPGDAEGMAVKSEAATLDVRTFQSNAEQSSGCTVIDVMVVWSDDILDMFPTTPDEEKRDLIENGIQLSVDKTNKSYEDSEVDQRLRLVHVVEWQIDESPGGSDVLDDLQDPDGPYKELHTLRDAYGADCVSLWLRSLGDYTKCGKAFSIMTDVGPDFAEKAFSIVSFSCGVGNYTFGHELGHLMGAQHDCYVNQSDKPYVYSHGYVYPGSGDNHEGAWRTIMAYNDECVEGGFECPEIPLWSNPYVTYNGEPTGEEDGDGCDANVAKTLNNTASTVAAFRGEALVSDAGGPYTAECDGETTSLQLDGTDSTLPGNPCGGPALTYLWTTDCPGGAFDDNSSLEPELTLDTSLLPSPVCPQTCNVTLAVSKGDETPVESTETVTIEDNVGPEIMCSGLVYEVECGDKIAPPEVQDCNEILPLTYEDDKKDLSCGYELLRTWTATDVCGNSNSCVEQINVVDDTPPQITPPADVTIECDESKDPSNTGGFASAVDICDGELPAASISYSDASSPRTCPEIITRTWTATDACGNTSSCVQTIQVVDTTAPVIENVTANPNKLWPPNHKMVQVTVAAIATDNCDSSPDCAILRVVSNESFNGLGDGNTAPDWVITGDLTLGLRAERSGKGDGRIYTIEVTCTDECGNSSAATTGVTVPHDKGKRKGKK